AGAFLDAVAAAAPAADVVLLHASPPDMARLFVRRAARPLLLAADDAEAVKHAYAACKLLAQRCRLLTFDLLLLADPRSPRLQGIASTLAGCADRFLGALLREWAVVDPASDVAMPPPHELLRLVDAQIAIDEHGLTLRPPPPAAVGFQALARR
nr:flagellar biosynthesis protein [Rubrivivax sp.]